MRSRSTIPICFLALTCLASHHVVYYPKAIRSPKGSEQDVPMLVEKPDVKVNTSPAPATIKHPFVFHTPIAWDYPSNTLSTIANFRIYSGPSRTNYTTNTLAGKVLTNSFPWLRGTTNFLSVTAIGTNGLESDYSCELRIPGVPLTNLVITVTSSGATNLQFSTSVSGYWTNLGATNWAQTNPPTLFWRAVGRSRTSPAVAYIKSKWQ